jgi:hypothetical protein
MFKHGLHTKEAMKERRLLRALLRQSRRTLSLYPEYDNLSDYELIRMLYGIRVRPWATLGMWASIAVGIPLVVLVLGASLV